MAKEPIWWHQECLRIAKEEHERDKAMLERLRKAVVAQQADIERHEAQLERAVREGRDGFDADKFQPKKGGGC